MLQAAKALKEDRRVALCHEGFMEQLVQYARAQGMLDPCPVTSKHQRTDEPWIYIALDPHTGQIISSNTVIRYGSD